MARRNTHRLSEKHALPFKTGNKQKRQDLFIKQKQVREKAKRDVRFSRKKEEAQNPRLRAERLENNAPLTIDRKRVWDDIDSGDDDMLGLSIDIEQFKKRKLEQEAKNGTQDGETQASEDDEDADSMLDSDPDSDSGSIDGAKEKGSGATRARVSSPPRSTASTNLELMPETLANKFSSLFDDRDSKAPKILITTTINSTLHYEASLLMRLFPNSVYIPRSAHHYAYKYSVKEISKFATNRNYTAVVIMREDQKKPCGLDIVHLPSGPMFHFSMQNWVEGKKLPGHGKPTNHYPELLLNNFKTPLGLLTAKLFHTMFPMDPEIQGRQVVTLHNQRDFIFVRYHRYVFRDKRETEKAVVQNDGKEFKGFEDIKAGLQELGPRFTLKLRRVDKGIQRSSGQEWEWKGKTDRIRTKFQL